MNWIKLKQLDKIILRYNFTDKHSNVFQNSTPVNANAMKKTSVIL